MDEPTEETEGADGLKAIVLRLPAELVEAMADRARSERRSRNQWAQVVLENALASKLPVTPLSFTAGPETTVTWPTTNEGRNP